MFKQGDKVIDSQRGEGVVDSIKRKKVYALIKVYRSKIVIPNTILHQYDLNGCVEGIKCLFHKEGYIPPSSAEPKRLPYYKVDERLIVWDTYGGNIERRYFSHFDESGFCHCFKGGVTSWTGDMSPTHGWKHYARAEV